MYLALTTFLAEEVAAEEHIAADLAQLCKKRFSSKSSCDAINDLSTFAFMRERSKFNFRCATHFFGEILRIDKKVCIKFARVTSKM